MRAPTTKEARINVSFALRSNLDMVPLHYAETLIWSQSLIANDWPPKYNYLAV